jgi:hypothetical protein
VKSEGFDEVLHRLADHDIVVDDRYQRSLAHSWSNHWCPKHRHRGAQEWIIKAAASPNKLVDRLANRLGRYGAINEDFVLIDGRREGKAESV